VAVVEAHQPQSRNLMLDGPLNSSVLIEEARRRQRRRRIRIVVAGLAVGSLAAGLTVALDPGDRGPMRVPTRSPQFSKSVAAATSDAGSADISIVLGTTFPPGFPGCRSQVTNGTGTVNFKTNSIGLSLVNHGVGLCGSPFVMQVRQLGSVLYATDPSTRHVLTAPGKPWLKTPWTSPEMVPGFGNGGIRAGTTAGFLFTALRSLQNPVTPIGTKTLNGTTVNGYRGTFTLAELQSASRT
jgi:hypothetical protein